MSEDHPGQGEGGWLRRIAHLFDHDRHHEHGTVISDDLGLEGIRATKLSLASLGLTAALQAVIVVLSGSVALLSDTLHNLGDALTAIPLWIAFSLGRRKPSRGYTYGLNRAEDVAGLVIVAAIAGSALLVGWESFQRLFQPRLIDQAGWVIGAGLIGAAGNEWVARYRMRVGRRIGSAALVADGHHARSDAWTSLAVVAAGIGATLGWAWVDPVAGLVVAVAIVWLLGGSIRSVGRRLLDGVDPQLVEAAETVIRGVEGVQGVGDLKLRFHGHRLHLTASIAVDPDLTVAEGHGAAQRVEHDLFHALPYRVTALIHVDPHGRSDAHQVTAHHH